jgi:putative ABC transport system permease protein
LTERLNLSNVDTQWGQALLTGVDSQTQLYQKQVIAGRWFTDSDQNVALISQDAAQKSKLHVGDTIAFHDALHNAQWHIIGIVRDNNNQSNITFGVLVAPMKQINAFLHVPSDDARTIMLRSTYHTQENTYALVQAIDEKMNANGFQPIIETAAQEMRASKNQYQLLDTLLYVATLLIAATGAIGLFNTLTMSVIEQRREIGILRSMGAKAVQIALVF